jgi:hypothetical protein
MGPQGLPGAIVVLKSGVGAQGPPGESIVGPQGEQGVPGESIIGPPGESITGPPGKDGESITGPPGESIVGPKGDSIIGPQGPPGKDGEGIVKCFADFYTLTPNDSKITVSIGGRVEFPQTGPVIGITRINSSQFNLPNIGIYEVLFQVSITEPGQLVIVVNGVENLSSVVGRATGTSQIVGMSLIKTSAINTIISINNPLGEPTALTVTPLSGGKLPVSAHLIIKQIS